MTEVEAREWLDGKRSMENVIPPDPHGTWQVRIAQADTAMMQRASIVLTYSIQERRDYFAGLAMQGLTSSYQARRLAIDLRGGEVTAYDVIARWAYEQADAMLAERQVRRGGVDEPTIG